MAYLCGASAIQTIGLVNPAAPQSIGATSVTNGFICTLQGNNLLELNGNSNISVYGLTDPTQPALLASATALANWFTDSIVPAGGMVYFSSDWYTLNGAAITSQHGEFFSYDFTNPASPVFLSQLMPTAGVPESSDLSPRWKVALIDSATAVIASTTATGGSTGNGTGLAEVVDLTNPASLQVVGAVALPNTAVATGVAVQDGIALLIGNTSGWRNPATPNALFTGNLTLSAVDVTSPRRPSPRGTLTVVRSTAGAYSVVGIGHGRFAVSVSAAQDAPTGTAGVLGIVDASNPSTLTWTETASILQPQDLSFSNGLLLVAGGSGLSVFRVN